MVRGTLFSELNRLPVGLDRVGVVGFDVAINMGMPANQLVADAIQHVSHVKVTLFAGNFTVKHQMQKEVSELFAEFGPIARINGICEFVGLFEGENPQGLLRLHAVPRALGAQVVHDVQ